MIELDNHFGTKMNRPTKEEILQSINNLRSMHEKGLLGGGVMPEDENPGLPLNSKDNYHYFSLTMALNYQRNSYKLWQSAKMTYNDPDTRYVYKPEIVVNTSDPELSRALTKYKVALQPIKQPIIWKKICNSICNLLEGDIRNLFTIFRGSVPQIINYIQKEHKTSFPYLSGGKICNYWLYVMENYTDCILTGREFLTIAPDTHVIQSTIQLGLVNPEYRESQDIQKRVNELWKEILDGTGILPIDIHTALWLWSRSGFKKIVNV
jgi:hypothetical protein